MGFFKALKDVALLPIDVVLDVTMITPTVKFAKGDYDNALGTVERVKSIVKNIEETYDK